MPFGSRRRVQRCRYLGSSSRAHMTLHLDRRDAVDLDVETSRPCWNADEDTGGRVLGKVTGIDRVDLRKPLDRRAVHIALEDILQRRSRRLQAKLHLLQDQLGLPLDRSMDDRAGVGSNGGSPET